MKFNNIRRPIIRTAVVLTAVYLLIAGLLYLLQDQLIFQRQAVSPDTDYHFDQPGKEYFITGKDDVQLNAWYFTSRDSAKGLIIYFHGNRNNLQRWGTYAADFTSLGYDILMVDYRGYGKSGGSPGEADFYSDARTVWNWATATFPHNKTILYGRSLGSAVAANLATEVNPDLLIMETPFDELRGTPYTWLRQWLGLFGSRHRFPNIEFVPAVKCPIVIIHGTDDWVVPLSSAQSLRPLLKPSDEFVLIEGGSHNNLRDFETYHNELNRILNR